MKFLSLLLLGLSACGHPWSVCEVVLVPYVDAAVAVTVLRVMLFLLDVCMLRECKGARVTAMLLWGTGEVWLGCAHGMRMWVVQVLCLTQLTCYG